MPTASQAEQVCARVAQALIDAGLTNVERDRQDAITREEGPAIVVEAMGEDTDVFGQGPETDRSTLRFVVIYTTRERGTWQQTLDGLRTQGHAALIGDAELNRLLARLRRTRAEWHAATADLPVGYLSQQYVGQYLSPRAALSSPA